MSLNNVHTESNSVAVKEEFIKVEVKSCEDDIEDNEMVSRDTVHTQDLGIKNDISTQPISSNKIAPVAVKKEFIEIKESSIDDIEDETIPQPAVKITNLRIKHDLSSFNDHLHNENTPVVVKEELNQDENSCVDNIEYNEMANTKIPRNGLIQIPLPTVRMINLKIKHDLSSFNEHLHNESTPVVVKEEFIKIEIKSCEDDMEDNEMISRDTVNTQELGIKNDISVSTTQPMPSNNESTPVAAKKEFIQIKESSVDDIEDKTVINNESSQVNDNATKHSKSCYCCDICYKILSKKSLRKHMRVHSKIKPFACSECDKSFSQRCHLEEHMRIHTGEKPYPCSQCHKTFSRRTTLKTHMRSHTGEKPYACSQCKQSFSQNGTLNSHMRSHTGEKPYACSQCNKSFTSNIVLKIHMRIHTGEKPFACSHCNKAFSQSVNLQRHVRIHSDEKPYVCSQCNKSFTSSGMLKIHMRIHTGEKPYACSNCNKAFTQKVNLQRHMKTHSEEKPYACVQCNKSFSKSSGWKKHKILCKVNS